MGAGAVGGYFGALLHEAGEDVTFFVRPARKQQLERGGLQIKSVHGDLRIEPKLAEPGQAMADMDLLLLAVKNYHLPDLIDDLRIATEQGAVVLPLLNGIHHMDHLVAQCGPERVVGGGCSMAATLNDEGHVVHTSQARDIFYGVLPASEDQGRLQSLLVLLGEGFAKTGVRHKLSDHVMQDMWDKYVFLCAFSAATAATRLPIGFVLSESKTKVLFSELVRELIHVATAKGVEVKPDWHERMMERVAKLDPMMTSSMHRDLEKGLPLELDSLQGALCDMARQMGLPTPAHETLYAILAPHRSGRPAIR